MIECKWFPKFNEGGTIVEDWFLQIELDGDVLAKLSEIEAHILLNELYVKVYNKEFYKENLQKT